MVDGIAAVELAGLLLDPTPEPPRPSPTTGSRARRRARASAGATRCGDLAREQLELATLPARVASLARGAPASSPGERSARVAALALASPRAAVGASTEPISPLRHLARLERPLDDLRAVKRALRARRVNDVVLAASAGGVRRFFARARRAARCALKTMVPVSVRDDGDDRTSSATGSRSCSSTCPATSPTRSRRLREHPRDDGRAQGDGEPEGGDAVLELARLRAAAAAATRSRG